MRHCKHLKDCTVEFGGWSPEKRGGLYNKRDCDYCPNEELVEVPKKREGFPNTPLREKNLYMSKQ